MGMLARLLSLRNTLFRKDRLDRELDDELRAAIDTLAERYVADGFEAVAARRAAAAALGGVLQVKDEVRANRIGAGLDALLSDLRYAWRGLRKAPGFAVVVVITLGLGIGANTAIFSIVRAMLLEPLPYRDPDRLAFVWLGRNEVGYRGPLSGPDLRDLREGTTTFEQFGAIWASSAVTLTGGGEPEQLRAALVTTNFFEVLGVESALGRTFRAGDSAPGAEPTILLGWELFQRRFGADPAIVGRTIDVNESRATVIGVMPRNFRLLLPSDASVPDRLQAFVPFWPDLENGPRGNLFLRVVGRMRPGVRIADAQQEVSAVAGRISTATGRSRVLTAIGLHADDVREIRGPLTALFVGVGILLLIACVNVASLLIARAVSRTSEISLRLALGASAGRMLRLFLVEGLLLTILGSAAGLIIGSVGLRILLAVVPESLSRLESARIDSAVLAFTIAVSFVAGLLFSMAPRAALISGSGAGRALQPDGRTAAPVVRRRARATLVTVQIALSVVLLVGAGLLVRTFMQVLRIDPGFRTDRQLTFRIAIPERYDSIEGFNAFGSELQRRLAAIPGVTSVGVISHLPYDDMPNWSLIYSLDASLPTGAPSADSRAISTGLFETLGVEIIDGRQFTDDDDDPKNAVAIIDDRLARDLWPSRSAVGQQFFTTVAGMNAAIGSSTARLTVVGVVPHLRLRSLVEDFRPQIFMPWRIARRNPMAYVIGTSRDPSTLVSEVRALVAALDARIAVYDVRAMETYVEQARSTRQFTMLLAAAFALVALTLTLVGIYGVLAYSIAHRRREIGVRRALGAGTGQVVREVVGEGMLFACIGGVGGLAGAAVAARWLQGQLYAVNPIDPLTYAVALGLILVGAALACSIPARRATAISPLEALRGQ